MARWCECTQALTGHEPISETVDADVVADIRAHVDAVPMIIAALESLGFQPEPGTGRFAKKAEPLTLLVDLLIPEGAGQRRTEPIRRLVDTVQVPGGTQALRRTELVAVTAGGQSGAVPVPSMLGAILLKSCACMLATTEKDKHESDLAFLLAICDPLSMQLRRKDARRLGAVESLRSRSAPAWLTLTPDSALRGWTALHILLNSNPSA